MNLREASQQALEALESVEWYGAGSGWIVDADAIEKSITALRAALAEPVHETIARLQKARAQFDEERRQALEQGKCSSCGQELPEELKTQYLVNHDLPMGCDHCNHPLYAAIRCRVCGRDTDPMSKVADAEKKLGLDYMEEKK